MRGSLRTGSPVRARSALHTAGAVGVNRTATREHADARERVESNPATVSDDSNRAPAMQRPGAASRFYRSAYVDVRPLLGSFSTVGSAVHVENRL